MATASWISSSTDLLQLALCDETRRAFECPPHCAPHSSSCMNLFGFIRFFMEWAETLHKAQYQTSLSAEDYLHCKKLLFSAFYDMDRDDDRLVSFKDLTDYLIRQRALTSEMSRDRTFHVERAYQFDSGAKGEMVDSTTADDANDHVGASLPGGEDEDDAPSPFDPPTVMKLLSGQRWGHTVGLVCRAKEIRFVDASMQIVDGFRCCPTVTSPVIDFDTTSHDDLVVTGHQDRILRVWSSRDARGLNRSKWRVAYQHECDAVPAAVCAHRRSERVFTGSSKGGITMWRLSNALISDYGKGDRGAFESILSASWAPGVFHGDTVKAISCFQRVDRVVSCALDGTVGILDVPHQTKLQSFKTQRGILSMALCEEFSLLCTCGYDKDPCIWDYTTALRVPTRLIDAADPHQGAIHSVSVVTGGSTLLATCDAVAKVKFWDLRMMRCIQSMSLDRSGAASTTTGGGSSNSSRGGGAAYHHKKPLANAMVQCPWGSIMVAGRSVYSIAEKREVLPRQMSLEPAVDVTFDHQTGMILALHHDNSISTWLNGEARGVMEIHQRSRYLEKGESLRSLCAFPSRGRKAVLTTSLGRLLIVNTETGSIVDACMAFDRVAVKRCVIGTFEAKPFVLALAKDGGIYCWKHPALPVHTVLPPVEVTAVSLGTTDGEAWIGTVNGSVYHIYLPEAVCSPPLITPETPTAVTALTLIEKLGVMVMVRADSELVVYNASYQAEVLHTCYPAVFGKQPPRQSAAVVVRKRDGTSEGFFSCADDMGRIFIFRIGSKVVNPDPAMRRKQFQLTVQKSMFGVAVSAMSALSHWHAFAVTSEDCMGKIYDRHGVELASLSQQHAPWPATVLPYTTNAEQSKQVATMIHRLFSRLKRRAAARKAAALSRGVIESRRPTLQRRQSRAMSFARSSEGNGNGGMQLDELPFTATMVITSLATESSDGFEATMRDASFHETPDDALRSSFAAARASSSRGLIQMTSGDVTPSVSPSRVGQPITLGKSVRFVQKGLCTPKRPSSAPFTQHPVTQTASRMLGDKCVKKTELKKALRSFTGQIAVVSPRALQQNLSTTTVVVECSNRQALPIALDRVVAQQALDAKDLPPSTLWAPTPRPPSPLQSRVRPRRNQ